MSKIIQYLEKCYGDDLGRGKSNVSKHRHKHLLKVRLRNYLKTIELCQKKK